MRTLASDSRVASPPKIGGEQVGMATRFADLGINRPVRTWRMQLPRFAEGDGKMVYRFPVLVQPVYDGVPTMWTGERLLNGVGNAVVNRAEADVERELFLRLHGVQLDGEITRFDRGMVFVVHDTPTTEDAMDRWRHIEQVLPEDGRVVMKSACVQAQRKEFAKVIAEMFDQGFSSVTVYSPGYGYVEGRSDGVSRITFREWESME